MRAVLFFLVAALALFLFLLWQVGGVEWMQDIYLWIAHLENDMRGIDGITEASRVKVMDDATRHFAIFEMICKAVILIALLLFCLNGKKHLDRLEKEQNNRKI